MDFNNKSISDIKDIIFQKQLKNDQIKYDIIIKIINRILAKDEDNKLKSLTEFWNIDQEKIIKKRKRNLLICQKYENRLKKYFDIYLKDLNTEKNTFILNVIDMMVDDINYKLVKNIRKNKKKNKKTKEFVIEKTIVYSIKYVQVN